jgi:hypothetical protein
MPANISNPPLIPETEIPETETPEKNYSSSCSNPTQSVIATQSVAVTTCVAVAAVVICSVWP